MILNGRGVLDFQLRQRCLQLMSVAMLRCEGVGLVLCPSRHDIHQNAENLADLPPDRLIVTRIDRNNGDEQQQTDHHGRLREAKSAHYNSD